MKRNALATLTLSTLTLTVGFAGCNKPEEAAQAPGYGSVNPKGEPAVAPTQAAKVSDKGRGRPTAKPCK